MTDDLELDADNDLLNRILGKANVLLLTTTGRAGTLGASLHLSEHDRDVFELGVCLGMQATLDALEP